MFSVGCFWLPLISSFDPFKCIFFLFLQVGGSLIVSYPFWIPKQYQFEAFPKNEGIVFGCDGADEGGFFKEFTKVLEKLGVDSVSSEGIEFSGTSDSEAFSSETSECSENSEFSEASDSVSSDDSFSSDDSQVENN